MMGLEKMICGNCRTTYYGNPQLDKGFCFMCQNIGDLLKIFGLDDLAINTVDFHRVREPEFEEIAPNDPKDWRNYIPEGLKASWQSRPVEARVIAVMFAEREARAIDIISDTIAAEVKKC